MENTTPGNQPSAEPQSERGDVGSRGTGSDKPSGGPVDRPAGAIEGDESVPAMGDDEGGDDEGGDDEAVAHGGGATLPPQDTDPVLPPYEGRQERAKPESEAVDAEGRNEGAAIPTAEES